MPSKPIQKAVYNRRNYIAFLYRCRRDSILADQLAGYIKDGHSLNQLMGELLAAHFNVPLPMRYYTTREAIWIPEKEVQPMELSRSTRAVGDGDCVRCHMPLIDVYYALPGGNTCEDCIQEMQRTVD